MNLEASQKTGGCWMNPTGSTITFDPERVTKGGSFLCKVSYCESYRPSARRGMPPDTGTEHVGIRCVKDPEKKDPDDLGGNSTAINSVSSQ